MTPEKLYRELSALADQSGAVSLMDASLRLTVPGYMPLTIETIGEHEINGAHAVEIAMSHYYLQNGDVVPDPDMTFFIFPDNRRALAASIQHNTGHYVRARKVENGRLLQNTKAAADLQRFAGQWLRNLRAQGFFEAGAA
jgi:hypothetical protein